MERQSNTPNQSPKTSSLHICQARLSAECQLRGGHFEVERRRGKAPGFCQTCAPLVRRFQSWVWKIRKRDELGSAEYRNQYGATYTRDEEQRKKWRAQKQRQREKRRALQAQAGSIA